MPWIIGIDEAGYGPNLGPLVMTSVACRVPQGLLRRDLWRTLRRAVRRHPSEDDGRLLIEDSKVVYSPVRGLQALETGVLATIGNGQGAGLWTLSGFVDWICPAGSGELQPEPWFTGASTLPVVCPRVDLAAAAARFAECCRKKEVALGLVRSVVVCPKRFNALLDRWGSKGAVLGEALAELVQANRPALAGEPLFFLIDKHGGRNNYYAMLQGALADSLVVTEQESMGRSVYRVQGQAQEVRFTIEPRADAAYFCVALASMVSKYLRELLMSEFNGFWQAQVPGLEPTAGYPGDAYRFFEAVRPAARRLGIPEGNLWRCK